MAAGQSTPEFQRKVEASLDSLTPLGKKHWANYPLGGRGRSARRESRSREQIFISPRSSSRPGLSSSAAVEVAVAFAMLNESDSAVDRAELAKLCQKAETNSWAPASAS